MAWFSLQAVGMIVMLGWGFAPSPVADVPPGPQSCAVDVLACDSDGDGIVNVVEEAVCGSATCATGAEDTDANGVPDAEELAVSLEQGGPGGPVRFPEFGTVRIVLPGPTVIDLAWWPAVVLMAAGAGAVVLVRRRGIVRRDEAGRARHSTVGS
jgi:hypothetical protein